MGLLEAALWGAFGGAISETPQLLRYTYRSKRPKWLKGWYFWGMVLLKTAVGGFFWELYTELDNGRRLRYTL